MGRTLLVTLAAALAVAATGCGNGGTPQSTQPTVSGPAGIPAGNHDGQARGGQGMRSRTRPTRVSPSYPVVNTAALTGAMLAASSALSFMVAAIAGTSA